MLTKEQKKIIWLSSLGGLLEFYDFTIYGLFAVYFAGQFFPSCNSFATILAGYTVFLIGYIVRPIGGIIFSHIGDEVGRKIVLIITMVVMGVASLGLGLMPTFDQIGIWAPILMVSLRLLQALAIGGELPSVIVYAAESMPEHRAFALGSIYSITMAGLLPGMLINIFITHHLTTEQITNFGWRIPFILGGLLCFIAYQIRRKLHETTAFTHLKQHNKFPLAELFRHHFGKLMIGVGLVSIVAAPIMLTIIFMPTYLTKILKFNAEQVSNTIFFMTCISVISVFIASLLASRYSPYKLMRNLTWCITLSAAICYFLLYKGCSLTLALTAFTIFQGALVALPLILLSKLFPVQIRLTGVALSYNLAFVIFGGSTPIIITTLVEHQGWVYLAPFICLLTTSIVTLFSLYQYRKHLLVNS